MVNHDSDLYNLTIQSGGVTSVVHTTSNHLFWDQTTHTWTRAAKLHSGDYLQTPDGTTATVVTGATPTVTTGAMWDLTINSDHDFYVVTAAAPILVHNCDPWAGKTFSDPNDAESFVNQETGGAKTTVNVGNGYGIRFVDNAVLQEDGSFVGNEVKVGSVGLDSDTTREALKDAELLQSGQFSSITWDFFGSDVSGTIGPSGPLAQALQEFGINVAVHA